MTIQFAYKQLLARLYEIYDSREAANIADWVIENVTGQRKIDRIIYKDLPVSEAQQLQLAKLAEELLQHKPVQYVLGEAWFADMKLMVNKSVLIPRPETEELVEWMSEDIKKSGDTEILLVDVGTGSGCIAIAMKKKLPGLKVSAIDVSKDALEVAKLNSLKQKTNVEFLHLDFLNENEWNNLNKYDIIASNPPYIKESEAAEMQKNVLQYEPHLALFVPNENALTFYEAIARFSREHLKPNGSVYVEINEALGDQVVKVFAKNGLSEIILKKDLQGKDRMVKATRAS
ncbi:peptide chain release factor N(5)-glutamine methyltransferase [Segetibacter koreensis]|uniref:peptide chain release factor N(5)-glutamine methyltransferase n=1 Tax=Segetibacter koreensis TaxID=398037 RepID=UPI00037736DE|nr:peptide chain release factor N(5)-glutamine methyltransferase [Segetibacter koreensis]